MRTAGPATGPSFAAEHVFFDAPDVVGSGGSFLHRGGPADELVACQGCEVVPSRQRLGRRG